MNLDAFNWNWFWYSIFMFSQCQNQMINSNFQSLIPACFLPQQLPSYSRPYFPSYFFPVTRSFLLQHLKNAPPDLVNFFSVQAPGLAPADAVCPVHVISLKSSGQQIIIVCFQPWPLFMKWFNRSLPIKMKSRVSPEMKILYREHCDCIEASDQSRLLYI